MTTKGPKYALCGYCPSKLRRDPDGWVLPSSRGDVPYEDHARMHESYGPAISHTFVRAVGGKLRPPRELPAKARGYDGDDAPLFQQDRGWD